MKTITFNMGKAELLNMVSMSHETGRRETFEMKWQVNAIEYVDVDEEKEPRVYDTGEVVGFVTSASCGGLAQQQAHRFLNAQNHDKFMTITLKS